MVVEEIFTSNHNLLLAWGCPESLSQIRMGWNFVLFRVPPPSFCLKLSFGQGGGVSPPITIFYWPEVTLKVWAKSELVEFLPYLGRPTMAQKTEKVAKKVNPKMFEFQPGKGLYLIYITYEYYCNQKHYKKLGFCLNKIIWFWDCGVIDMKMTKIWLFVNFYQIISNMTPNVLLIKV